MKQFVILVIAILAPFVELFAQNNGGIKKNVTYMFGVSASFKDSTAYVTEVQRLDSVAFLKDGSIVGMPFYSDQLKNYLATKGKLHQICMVFYFEKEKSAIKKQATIKKRFLSDKTVFEKDLTNDEFHFIPVNYKQVVVNRVNESSMTKAKELSTSKLMGKKPKRQK